MTTWSPYSNNTSAIRQAMRAACFNCRVEFLDSMRETEFGWRFEDRRYAAADEFGDYSHSYTQIEFHAYLIHHRTKCGMWLMRTGNHDTLYFGDTGGNKPDRFVNLQANKKWAVDSVQGAIDSFVARKKRQARIYKARVSAARHAISLVKREPFGPTHA